MRRARAPTGEDRKDNGGRARAPAGGTAPTHGLTTPGAGRRQREDEVARVPGRRSGRWYPLDMGVGTPALATRLGRARRVPRPSWPRGRHRRRMHGRQGRVETIGGPGAAGRWARGGAGGRPGVGAGGSGGTEPLAMGVLVVCPCLGALACWGPDVGGCGLSVLPPSRGRQRPSTRGRTARGVVAAMDVEGLGRGVVLGGLSLIVVSTFVVVVFVLGAVVVVVVALVVVVIDERGERRTCLGCQTSGGDPRDEEKATESLTL